MKWPSGVESECSREEKNGKTWDLKCFLGASDILLWFSVENSYLKMIEIMLQTR